MIMQVLGALVSLALVAGGQSATKANFSGEWKMNVMKSDFGALPPPEFITRTILHVEAASAFEELIESGAIAELTAPEDHYTAYERDAILAKDYMKALRLRTLPPVWSPSFAIFNSSILISELLDICARAAAINPRLSSAPSDVRTIFPS